MTQFKSFVFDGKNSARKALDKLEETDNSFLWLEEGDVAEISVNKKGNYRVHSTWAQDSTNVPGGIGFGALLGGMLGVLFGPVGLIAGAAYGGTIGGLIGAADNIDFDDPVLDDFAASLLPDTSALIILGEDVTIAEFTGELEEYEAKVFETELDKEVIAALKNELKKANK
ncbi:DUF1269 domain-containing protein [Draconibacterium sp. IB214405]|uniref:DUF1269 domain-containing protein n=1 Tax=Draconibacterium sp. IB214405 TaxID=3097352 RepID=UPI002A12D480|nr:DUF1269 domain-containing protein [Draconibacterium sp. IB214405]MDX8339042.1 DUF1269 domain-containing protein [Draconibacterium sp. IB214405]